MRRQGSEQYRTTAVDSSGQRHQPAKQVADDRLHRTIFFLVRCCITSAGCPPSGAACNEVTGAKVHCVLPMLRGALRSPQIPLCAGAVASTDWWCGLCRRESRVSLNTRRNSEVYRTTTQKKPMQLQGNMLARRVYAARVGIQHISHSPHTQHVRLGSR